MNRSEPTAMPEMPEEVAEVAIGVEEVEVEVVEVAEVEGVEAMAEETDGPTKPTDGNGGGGRKGGGDQGDWIEPMYGMPLTPQQRKAIVDARSGKETPRNTHHTTSDDEKNKDTQEVEKTPIKDEKKACWS